MQQSEQNLDAESTGAQTTPGTGAPWWQQQVQKRNTARWWQQGETATSVVLPEKTIAVPAPATTLVPWTAISPVAVAVAPPVADLDIGEALEAEALQRSIAEARGERVVIYADNRQNVKRLKKRMQWTAIPIALYGILALLQPGLFFAIWLFLIVECIGLYYWSKRVYSRQTLPVVTLTHAGIELHTMGHDLGLVRWGEIGDIRAYNCLYRYVGITPRDTPALCARLNRRQRTLIKANTLCIPLYRVFRQFVAPINLAQQNLPLSADALVAKIEAFRATHRV